MKDLFINTFKTCVKIVIIPVLIFTNGKTKLTHGKIPLIHGKTKLTNGKTKLTHGKAKFTHGKTEKTSWSAVAICT